MGIPLIIISRNANHVVLWPFPANRTNTRLCTWLLTNGDYSTWGLDIQPIAFRMSSAQHLKLIEQNKIGPNQITIPVCSLLFYASEICVYNLTVAMVRRSKHFAGTPFYIILSHLLLLCPFYYCILQSPSFKWAPRGILYIFL
jgi:hypothetical protein